MCEPDEYARFVSELKASGLIKNHGSVLQTHKNSFKGKDFVNWVMKTKGVGEISAEAHCLYSTLTENTTFHRTTKLILILAFQLFGRPFRGVGDGPDASRQALWSQCQICK